MITQLVGPQRFGVAAARLVRGGLGGEALMADADVLVWRVAFLVLNGDASALGEGSSAFAFLIRVVGVCTMLIVRWQTPHV